MPLSLPLRSTLVVLLAAAQPGAWAMDPPAGAGRQTAAAAPVFRPGGIRNAAHGDRSPVHGLASLGGAGIFVLRGGKECSACTTKQQKRTCRHVTRATLTYLHPPAAGAAGTWSAKTLALLPADAAGLVAGPGSTLIVGSLQGGFSRIRLKGVAPKWQVARVEPLLTAERRLALALPDAPQHAFAIDRDGRLLLSYERDVALLPADLGAAGKDSVQWLVRKPVPEVERKAEDSSAGSGMEVAADAEGQVLVIDPAARAVYGIVPAGKPESKETTAAPKHVKQLIAHKHSWGVEGFVPGEAVAFGRNLIVSGTGAGGEPRLIALAPQAPGQLYAAQDLQIPLRPGDAFAATPAGHLIVWNGEEECIEFRSNLEALDEAGLTREAAKRQEAAAAAAFGRLIKEEQQAAENKGKATAAVSAEREPAGAETDGLDESERAEDCPEDQLLAWISRRTETESKRPSPAIPAAGKPSPAGSGATGKENWRNPSGSVSQRTIVAKLKNLAASEGFDAALKARLKGADPRAIEGLLRLQNLGAADGASVPTEPRFALATATLERVVRWLLQHPERANNAFEVAQWRLQPHTRPGFSLGLYEFRNRVGVTLEIEDLQGLAHFMDDKWGDLSAELAATGGRTGIRVGRDGKARFAYGLTVTLGDEPARILAIRPGGYQSMIHRPLPAAAETKAAAGAAGAGFSLLPPAVLETGSRPERKRPAESASHAGFTARALELSAGAGLAAACKAGIEHHGESAPAGGLTLADLDPLLPNLAERLTAESRPLGLARFALDEGAVRRTVRWMLANADRANRPGDLARCSRQSPGASGLGFGLYAADRSGVLLEISNLQMFAGFEDTFRADAELAGQLNRSSGCTGLHLPGDGTVRYAYGLTVGLAEDLQSIQFIRPGGAHLEESLPAGKAAGPAPAGAGTESKLNPKAAEFVPAES